MKKAVEKTTCPADGLLRSYLPKIDFEDAYSFSTLDHSASMEEVYSRIFNTAPKWVEYALRFRNLLVKPFGLKTEIDKNQPLTLKEGEKAGIFKIYKILENEIIAGEDDRHLDFRVSVYRNQSATGSSIITVSTIVQYNNWFGRMYMTVISPFHKMVVKSILKSSQKRFDHSPNLIPSIES